MCEIKPLPRCAGHAGPALEAALRQYRAAHPGGPSPCVLLAAECQIGALHAHVATAGGWARSSESAAERSEAQRYLEDARARLHARWAERDSAARDRLATVRAARAGGAGAAGVALTADEHERWVAAGRDAELSESRATRFDGLADAAAWDGDERAAGRHAWMADRCRESAALARQEQQALLERARARTRAAAA